MICEGLFEIWCSMLSKWQVWDFYHQVLPNIDPGFKAIIFFDPWIEYKIIQEIKLKNHYNTIPSFEITRDWLEDRLLGLSLFGEADPIIITQAEHLNSTVKEFIKDYQNELENKEVILSFTKDDPFIKSIEKNKAMSVFKVEAPKFWESQKLLNFILEMEQVRLTEEAKSFLLDSVAHDCSNLFYYINLFKVNYGNEKVEVATVKQYLSTTRLDQFALASMFNAKKKNQFVETFLKTKVNAKEAILFFGFMLSHVIKLMDSSYLENKNYKSKYDKEILAFAGNWSKEELKASFNFFERCQLLAKKDFPALEPYLKYDLEQSYYNYHHTS